MSGNHLERVKTWLDAHGVIAGDPLESDLRALVAEVEQLRAERGYVAPRILRTAWRNGWSDHDNAIRQAIADSGRQRDDYERAFARYMSEDPAEDDKDPYRPLDGPDDPAADTSLQQLAQPPECPECGRTDVTLTSDFHMAMLAVSAAWTALVGALYRRAVTKWIEDDDGA